MAAYEWTDDDPPCCQVPQLEPHQRMAISMAARWLAQAMDEGRERPHFSGGFVASAKNDTAREMLVTVDEALALADQETGLTAQDSTRAMVVTVAVRAADYLWRQGQLPGSSPEQAWARYVAQHHFARGA